MTDQVGVMTRRDVVFGDRSGHVVVYLPFRRKERGIVARLQEGFELEERQSQGRPARKLGEHRFQSFGVEGRLRMEGFSIRRQISREEDCTS